MVLFLLRRTRCSDELVFGTLVTRRGAAWRPEDRQLRDEIVRYWTNFAKTGDLNSTGLANFPRYDKDEQILHLDKVLTYGPDQERE